jgi:hypothetical protein
VDHHPARAPRPGRVGPSVQVWAIYTQALELGGLPETIEQRTVELNADELLLVLLAVSDNGPQMISGTTREPRA